MEVVRKVTPDIVWLGGSDRRLALFENMFPLENGITYNSFLIMDEKTALIDTVDQSVGRQFIENLRALLKDRTLDYLVINHMEPDHCANIDEICRLYPGVQLVGNKKTFQLIQQFYHMETEHCAWEVKEGDTLSLGKHELRFFFAPMVHWPEAMFTYDSYDKLLFSADAFGTFGGYTGNLFADECPYEKRYLDEARRYYSNIVGKYGAQTKAALKKLENTEIKMICPLHGPILRDREKDLMLEKYALWSTYQPEEKGVVIAYASMYGNTESAVHLLGTLLAENGVEDIQIYDVSKTHFSYIIAEVFRCSHLVLASPTYNMKVYGGMETLLRDMAALNVQNRDVALIGNGSWAPAAGKEMERFLLGMKEMRLLAPTLEIKSALKQEQYGEMEGLAKEIVANMKING